MANFKGGFAFNNEAAKVEVEQAPDGTLMSCVNPVTGEELGGGGATYTPVTIKAYATNPPNEVWYTGENGPVVNETAGASGWGGSDDITINMMSGSLITMTSTTMAPAITLTNTTFVQTLQFTNGAFKLYCRILVVN